MPVNDSNNDNTNATNDTVNKVNTASEVKENTENSSTEDKTLLLQQLKHNLSSESCVICWEKGPNIVTLCCASSIHLHCLIEWTKRNPSCVMCRGQLLTKPVETNRTTLQETHIDDISLSSSSYNSLSSSSHWDDVDTIIMSDDDDDGEEHFFDRERYRVINYNSSLDDDDDDDTYSHESDSTVRYYVQREVSISSSSSSLGSHSTNNIPELVVRPLSSTYDLFRSSSSSSSSAPFYNLSSDDDIYSDHSTRRRQMPFLLPSPPTSDEEMEIHSNSSFSNDSSISYDIRQRIARRESSQEREQIGQDSIHDMRRSLTRCNTCHNLAAKQCCNGKCSRCCRNDGGPAPCARHNVAGCII